MQKQNTRDTDKRTFIMFFENFPTQKNETFF